MGAAFEERGACIVGWAGRPVRPLVLRRRDRIVCRHGIAGPLAEALVRGLLAAGTAVLWWWRWVATPEGTRRISPGGFLLVLLVVGGLTLASWALDRRRRTRPPDPLRYPTGYKLLLGAATALLAAAVLLLWWRRGGAGVPAVAPPPPAGVVLLYMLGGAGCFLYLLHRSLRFLVLPSHPRVEIFPRWRVIHIGRRLHGPPDRRIPAPEIDGSFVLPARMPDGSELQVLSIAVRGGEVVPLCASQDRGLAERLRAEVERIRGG